MKIFTSLLFSLLFSSSFNVLNAQFDISIEGGANAHMISYSPSGVYENNGGSSAEIGYYIGIVPRVKIGKSLYLPIDVRFESRNYEEHRRPSGIKAVSIAPSIEYVVGTKAIFAESESEFLKMLPDFGINAGVKYSYFAAIDSYYDDIVNIVPGIKDEKTSDLAAKVGLKLYFGQHFSLNADYALGLINHSESGEADINGSVTKVNGKFNLISAGIGYKF